MGSAWMDRRDDAIAVRDASPLVFYPYAHARDADAWVACCGGCLDALHVCGADDGIRDIHVTYNN